MFLSVLLLLGCSSGTSYAPIEDRSKTPFSLNKTHIVSFGETLYSIAWRYNLDVNGLANTNNIAPPYLIRPSQKLLLNDSKKVTLVSKSKVLAKTAKSDEVKKTVPRIKSVAPSTSYKKQPVNSKISAMTHWQWPSKAKVIKRFSARSPEHKGIDLGGVLREPVHAANSGSVVYAGNGLSGYGNLLIIKHSDHYLSAYAHNYKLLVSEGQSITAGQVIAEMGDTGTATHTVKLHFEIRRDGQPVNPLGILPKRR